MSIESAKALIQQIRTDKELEAKLTRAADKAERMCLAEQAGFVFTWEEMAQAKGELADEELDAAAGGWCILDGHCGQTCENDCDKDTCPHDMILP